VKAGAAIATIIATMSTAIATNINMRLILSATPLFYGGTRQPRLVLHNEGGDDDSG
jgi:hypothetical protein